MTKRVLLSLAALVFLGSVAQAQVRVGVKGGWNLANISTDNDGSINKNNSHSSFHIGVLADLPLSEILSFQPGVYYTGKGAKLESGEKGSAAYSKFTTNPQYIEIPLNFVGKIPIGENARLFAGVGPYFAFGVAGKNKYETTIAGVTSSGSSNIKWDDDTPFNSGDPNQGWDRYKRFDWGGNILAGVELGNNFLISAQYGLGLGKLRSGTDNSTDDNNKNRVFSVSVGYMFGRAPKP
ncbi:outer membrane protein with beta-barrel domain [Chitinophaga skermanii]|uniref:Outer membrane protein with beta-barrel domain n=1 Tax=Chitinophaga skermanii TaxID=331697 RepID=A0A327Q4R7_9BACT|nr:porin family protein [Chitinophaga skermanii]RAI98767.1 outer membrane protein with beta-barrel domain [Chitinophaga skermanii]